ncbi:major facilitator superfamily transporter [Fusarium proliferatum]|nr:major facilitator superfamily transporter [Fusarium proliferatum]KAG4285057.1 major facilitator superfamily transporter [Fusarium proliferatum]
MASTDVATPWHAAYPPPLNKTPAAMTRQAVLEMMKDSKNIAGKNYVLFDLRRTDHEVAPTFAFPDITITRVSAHHSIMQGGTIRGSINLPAQSLYPTIKTLYNLFKAAGVQKVIWYCSSSRGRGSRAAGWFKDHLDEQGDKHMESVILFEGITGWAKAGGEFVEWMDEKGLARPYSKQAPRLKLATAQTSTDLVIFRIGYVTAPFASKTWHLYLTQGALVGSGIGFIIVPSTAVLSQWFSKRRSMANGISSAGSGVGGAAFTWGTAAMIQRQGLSWALRTTGIITFVGIVIATLLLRDRNSQIQPNQRAVDITLLRSKAVVLLLLWAFISMFGYIVLLFSLSEFALAIGLSHKQATDVVGLLNVGTAVGRPLIGIASDRLSRVATAFMLTLLCGLSCFVLWLPAKSFGLMVFFSTVCGAIVGVFWMTIGPLSAEVAGIKNLQSVLSLAWAATIIPTAFEVIGYIGRTIPETLGAYIVQSIFLLVAPALFAVSIYMELGRIVDLVDGDHYLYVRRRWLTRILVIGDVLSFFMQGAGGGMMGSDDTNSRTLGEKLIVFGLFVQIVFFGCFVITAAMFHLRLCRNPTQKVIADKPSC